MRRLLVLGGSGQVGQAVQRRADAQWQVDAPTSDIANLTHPDELRRVITALQPTVIVNCAAYTKVDDAETNHDAAFAINAQAVEIMGVAARELGAHMVHLSTDYVFDGTGARPYRTDAATQPINVYGASKLAGEAALAGVNPAAVTVRTAWVHSGGGVNFVATAVRLFGAGKSMRVVDDQVGSPTRADTIAYAVLLLAGRRDVAGLLHLTDLGVASWYDVACCVRETMHTCGRLPADVVVDAVDSSVFPRPAKRPSVSILDTHTTRAVLGWTPPHWRDGVIASTRELLDA